MYFFNKVWLELKHCYFNTGTAFERFLSKQAVLCEPCPSSGGLLTQDCGAADSEDDGLSVAEDSRDLAASGTLDVHEVRVLVLHNLLQLVLAPLIRGSRYRKTLARGMMAVAAGRSCLTPQSNNNVT